MIILQIVISSEHDCWIDSQSMTFAGVFITKSSQVVLSLFIGDELCLLL